MDRRQFLTNAVASMTAGAALLGSLARAEEADPLDEPRACENAIGALIQTNHGHVLTVPPDDVLAGADKVYSIKGNATHDHQVALSAAQFAELRAGQTIQVSSTGGTHTHGLVLVRVA